MAVNKFINNPYRKPDCIKNLIYYATHKDGRWVNFFGGINVDVYHAADQMRAVKQFFRKNSDSRQVRHIVVGFDPRHMLNAMEADTIAKRICEYYADRYQIVYGAHEDTDNLHIHIVFNCTSFVDGKQYSGGVRDLNRFRTFVDEILR
ncbi:MAG: relaxase/mobilization nuclease domain-containing protein [Oscillospiraceae bacterium]|nr:relaxase/mobilization nuclease domain-containing protein [Oscillospiraceae bacterium]